MDAMMTAKGDVWVSCHYPAHIAGKFGTTASSPPVPQDPPQQVIDDCTKEVDEVVRYVTHPLSLCLSTGEG